MLEETIPVLSGAEIERICAESAISLFEETEEYSEAEFSESEFKLQSTPAYQVGYLDALSGTTS